MDHARPTVLWRHIAIALGAVAGIVHLVDGSATAPSLLIPIVYAAWAARRGGGLTVVLAATIANLSGGYDTTTMVGWSLVYLCVVPPIAAVEAATRDHPRNRDPRLGSDRQMS